MKRKVTSEKMKRALAVLVLAMLLATLATAGAG